MLEGVSLVHAVASSALRETGRNGRRPRLLDGELTLHGKLTSGPAVTSADHGYSRDQVRCCMLNAVHFVRGLQVDLSR